MHADGTISIRVNGEHRRVRDGLTLAEFASELGMAEHSVIVERNLDLIPRAAIADVQIEDGDELEISGSVG